MSGRSVPMSPPTGGVGLSSTRADRVRVGDHNDVLPRPFNSGEQHTLNLRFLIDAIERGDPEAQISSYAEGATLQLVDPDHPPRSPKLLTGKAEVAAWIQDVCSLRMTHRIDDIVNAGPLIAFTDEMRDRHGTQMVSTTTVTIKHGLILQQRVILVWDGWE